MSIHAGTDILLIGHDESLVLALQDGGFDVAWVGENEDLYAAVARLEPRAVLVHADSPTRDTLEHLASLSRRYPQPTVLLHSGHDADLTRNALQLGISAYVTEGLSPSAVRALIEVSINHQQQVETLRRELARSQKSLADRKLIGAAKCLLMERQGLSEAQAYRKLKTLAMNRRVPLSQAARDLLTEQET